MSTTAPAIHRGLAGVVVDTTEISTVIPETNSLTYRGYPVQDLAAHRSFEEVAHLLWYGELPDAAQLREFQARERALRPLDRTTSELLARLPETCHPMDVLRTAVSFFGAEDPTEDDGSPAAHRAKSLTLLAKLPTVVAADQRRRRGLAPVPPDPGLGYAENFFHKKPGGPVTCRDGRPEGADLLRWSFGCFTAIPIHAAGSPRKVPEGSQRLRSFFRLHACRRRHPGAPAAAHAGPLAPVRTPQLPGGVRGLRPRTPARPLIPGT
ncbi:citrate/2-methylcitrate synthase [Streptomyces sp. WAC 06783]|uniref:citrate/2-methylcitrate synthase n=1 Tax=Streptomyces sp. WAC 06783 TaxID=2203211 RepID=UPI0021AD5093|nr:citrate/2-methylcitrate synthase [Streptomyces sp. WAC 06783]